MNRARATLLFMVISILPIVQVQSRIAFATKITAVIGIANAIGIARFKDSTRRRVESLQ